MKERANLCSRIGLSLGIVTIPYFFILRSGSVVFGNAVALVCFCFLLAPILTFFKRPNLARIALILTMNITVLVYSLALGKSSGVHLLFMANLIIPFVIFDAKEQGKMVSALFIAITLMAILEWQNYMAPFQYSLTPNYLRLLHFTAMFFTAGVLIIIMLHFNRALKQILTDLSIRNEQLKQTNKELNSQKKKVDEVNFKLIKSQQAISKKMLAEYELAHKIKRQFLPKFQLQEGEYIFDSFYDGTAGNRCQYYDFMRVKTHLIIVAVDIELKGVATGYLTVHLNQLLHTEVESFHSSKDVFEKIQDGLKKSNAEFNQAKILSLHVDLESNTLTYTNNDWGIALYISGENIISLVDNTAENQLSFGVEDSLVIASKSLINSVNVENEPYGYDNLCKTIQQANLRAKNKLQKQKPLLTRINESIKAYVGVVDIPDDRFCFTLTRQKNVNVADV